MIIDLTCPIELRSYELLHDDQNNVRAYLNLYNLLDKRISKFEAIIRWISSDDEAFEDMSLIADQLRASARTAFTIPASTDAMPRADSIQVHFLWVALEDGSPDWVGDPARLIDVMRIEEQDGKMLNALMSVAGRDAVQFPRNTKDYWICVCDRVNMPEAERCVRCRREKNFVLTNFTREAVLLQKTPELPDTLSPDPIELDLPLFFEMPPTVQEQEPEEQEEVLGPKDEYEREHRQRSYTARRSIVLLLLACFLALSAFCWNWLGEKSERAKNVTPPVQIERSAIG